MNKRGWLHYFISFGLVYLLLFFSVSTQPIPVVEGICHVAVVDVSFNFVNTNEVRFEVILSYWNARPVTQRIIYDKYIDEMGLVKCSINLDNKSIGVEEPPTTWTMTGPSYTTKEFASGLTNLTGYCRVYLINYSPTNSTLPAGQYSFTPREGYFTTRQGEEYEILPSGSQSITRHSYTLIVNASGMFPIAEPLPEDWGSILAVDPYNVSSSSSYTTDYLTTPSTPYHPTSDTALSIPLWIQYPIIWSAAIITGAFLAWGFKTWSNRPR